MTIARVAIAGVIALFLQACGSDKPSSPRCPPGRRCDSSQPPGAVHPRRTDGTVDITVDEAWPDRPSEPAPLTPLELAQACAVLAACSDVDPRDGTIEGARRIVLALCAQARPDAPPGSGPGSYFSEERAVPTLDRNERWTFEARELIRTAASCEDARAVVTPRPNEIRCEEAGCWWSSRDKPIPSVSCQGNVATLVTSGLTFQRDCSRAFARCDEASPTGCTDRAPIACEHPAADRCDETIRLGCDGNGRLSFRDCARVPGGTCGSVEGGLGCVYPDAGLCDREPATCEGEALSICVFGEPLLMDCTALGLGACRNGLCPAP